MLAIRKSISCIVSLLFLLFGCIELTFCQQNKIFNYKGFTVENGLSSSNVRKIIQDKYGFVWIATQDGLNRFDGTAFVKFNSNTSDVKLKSIGNDFSDIILDQANSFIWAVTSNGGLNKIDIETCSIIERVSNYDLFDESSMNWGQKLYTTTVNIYVLSNKNLITQYSIATSKVVKTFNLSLILNSPVELNNFYISKDNIATIFLQTGAILFFDLSSYRVIKKIDFQELFSNDRSNPFYKSFSLFGDYILITSKKGLVGVNLIKQNVEYPAEISSFPRFIYQTPNSAVFCTDDQIYISAGLNLFQLDLQRQLYYNLKPSKSEYGEEYLKNIFAIYSQENTCWIGSQSGLMVIQNLESPFTGFSESFFKTKTKIDHSYHLFHKDDSTLFTCASDGLYKINLNNGNIWQIDKSAPYYQIFSLNNNQIFVSGENTIKQLYGNKLVEISNDSKILNILKNDLIIASAKYYDSIIFLASNNGNGLYEISLQSEKVKIINNSSYPLRIRDTRINNLFIDRSGRLLIICDQSIFIYDKKNRKIDQYTLRDPANGSVLEIIMDGCESNAHYYFAVYGIGIVQTDKYLKIKKIISEDQGLSNQGIYKIYCVGDSLVITGSNNGLFFYDIYKDKVKQINKEQGLHSNSFDETSGTQNKNLIFLGGNSGFTRVDLNKYKYNSLKPLLYLSSVEIKTRLQIIDTTNLFIRSIKIPKEVLQTTVSFSAINYSNPQGTTIKYRITEQNPEWIDIGNSNSLPLIGLSHGTYHLQVQAFNEDGVPSEIKELTLIFLPKWYQTWWFKTLVVLTIIASGYWLYRMRINQFNKEKQIRSKLASDLHDDLGSTINSVKVYANLAIMEKHQEKYLFKIKESTQEAITGIRDIIWVLDDSKDSIEHLLSRISLFASPLCEANGILYRQEISDEARDHKLGQEERRNLYMMLKEAVNNTIKYSEAKKIEIEVSVKKGKPAIQINDDGKGFDAKAFSDGNGLKNMKRRAQQIKYKFNIDSIPDQGTNIHFQKI